MTVLDASSVIALMSPSDAHHATAKRIFATLVRQRCPMTCSVITMAELLVGPARRGTTSTIQTKLGWMGVEPVSLPVDAAQGLARIRIETGLKLPDCCVIWTAQDDDSPILTFDEGLAKAAARLGLSVID